MHRVNFLVSLQPQLDQVFVKAVTHGPKRNVPFDVRSDIDDSDNDLRKTFPNVGSKTGDRALPGGSEYPGLMDIDLV
jgi:hypothetical protein